MCRQWMRRTHQTAALAFFAAAAALLGFSASAKADSDEDPINYSKTAAHDPIARLQQRIEKGEVKLTFNEKHGYLESMLEQLAVPASSQGFVFSKTSFQRTLINPHKPRAVYFNDENYVGFVQSAPVLELASMDKNLGTVFYALKQQKVAKPQIVRLTYECTQCHESGMTSNVPGLIMRSVYPDLEGQPILTAGAFVTRDTSPISQRWGGWYVTGRVGHQCHLGNVVCDDEDHIEKADLSAHANMTDLSSIVDVEPYLRPTSDVVALLVLAHQQHLHNLITSAGYQVKMALRDSDAINKALGVPIGQYSDSTHRRIASACEPVVKSMLFSGEAEYHEPIRGTSGFDKEFAAMMPRDSKGRSLRTFELNHRLFKYPCSYLIYSEQFDGLPTVAKTYIYHRFWEVLTGRDDSAAYGHLSDKDRTAIREILLDTKPDLKSYFEGARHEK